MPILDHDEQTENGQTNKRLTRLINQAR